MAAGPSPSDSSKKGKPRSGQAARSRTSTDSSVEEQGLSKGRRIGFTLAAILLPFALLILLEGGLRLVGYGSHPSLIIPVDGYEGYVQAREDVSARYFSSIANLPSVPFDWFTEPREADTFRIVFQGGSTAAGWPYYFSADMADVLEWHLNASHPEASFEVLNTAMAAVNSYTLLDLSEEIIALEPDAVMIYAGHNEYYGALGVGSSQRMGSSPAVINLYLALRPYRTVQLLQQTISAIVGLFASEPDDSASGRTLMQDMVGEQRIPNESDLFEEGLDQFRFNMNVLLARYADAGIPVYIGTLAANERDQPPFQSGSGASTTEQGQSDSSVPSTEEIDEEIRTAGAEVAAGRDEDALLRMDALLDRTPLYAGAHFVRARALENLGRVDEARTAYRAAKDNDELRFRAPEELNVIIRELASEHGATVVETQQALADASPNGLIGSDMMLEHLHPTIAGYRVLGGAFYMALAGNQFGADRGLRWAWDQAMLQTARHSPVSVIDSLAGAYRVQQLMGSWPFQPIGSRFSQIDTLMPGTLAGNLGLRLFQDDVPRIEALDAFRSAATQAGDLRTAEVNLQAVIQSYPMVAGPHVALAKIRMQQGRLEEAESLARTELAIGDQAEAFQVLGTLLLNRQRIDDAIPNLEKAVSMNPNDLRARYNLAGAYALRQRWSDARVQAEAILARNPNAQDARRLLNSLPEDS